MSNALLALILVVPLATTAQEPMDPLDFWPLEVGNVWEFERTYRSSHSNGGSEEYPDGYERWTVVRETELNGLPAFGLNIARYYDTIPPPDDPTHIHCTLAIELWGELLRIYTTKLYECLDYNVGSPYVFLGPEEPPEPTITIGTLEYPIEAYADGYDHECFMTSGCQFSRYYHVYGIGPVASDYSDEDDYSSSGFTRTLEYAVVGGQVYGTWPVANEPSPDGTSETPITFRVQSAYPNPFQDGVTVAFSLPAPEAVVLSLHDIRGRRVAIRDLGALPAGSHRAVVDGADLAPGLYLARLVTGSGQQASHRLVRAE